MGLITEEELASQKKGSAQVAEVVGEENLPEENA